MIHPLNQAPHLQALGWTLIHFCWQASVLAIAYKAVDLSAANPRTTSYTRYLFALTALLSMLVAASCTFAYEELRLTHAYAISTTEISTSSTPQSDYTFGPLNPETAPTAYIATLAALPRTEALFPWLDALWMLGVMALSIRTIGGWWLLQHLRSTATEQVPPHVAASFAALTQRLGIHTRVALRLSNRIASPLAVGLFRSLILLPASALTTLTPQQLEAVLAHELAHVYRADYLWNVLQTMIETLFFFHPAIWWVSASLRQQRELCCDDLAIAACADPVLYATALLALEEHRAQTLALHAATSGLPLALALDGNQSRFTFRNRIARILGEPMQPTSSPRAIAPFSILGACAALALFTLPIPQVLASLRPPAPTPTQTTATITPFSAQQPPPPAPVATPASASEPLPALASTPAPAPSQTPVAPRITVAAPAPPPEPLITVSIKTAEHDRLIATINSTLSRQDAVLQTLTVRHAAITAQTATSSSTTTTATGSAPKPDYITQMRAAGYDTDIDHYMAMKIHGITPEYARQMAQTGFGKPTVDNLIAMKIHNVTPEYLQQIQAAGLKPEDLQSVISYRIFNVTPEYIAAIKAAGFPDIPSKKIIELRIQNVTPEFARSAKQQFPDINPSQLTQLRIFRIDDDFIAKAKSLGLQPLTVQKLVQLRTSGLLDDQRIRD